MFLSDAYFENSSFCSTYNSKTMPVRDMLLAEGLAEEELIMLVLHEKKNQMLQLYINVNPLWIACGLINVIVRDQDSLADSLVF